MGSFDPNAEAKDQAIVQGGTHKCVIAWSDYNENKAKTGHYYRIRWDVRDDESDFDGMSFFTTLSTKTDVQAIASRWRSLSKAAGVEEAFDPDSPSKFTELFHEKPMLATVKVVEKDGFTNHDIQRLIADPDGPAGESEEVDDDDVPDAW